MGSEQYRPNDHTVQHIGGAVPHNQSWGGKGDLLAVETVSTPGWKVQNDLLMTESMPTLTVYQCWVLRLEEVEVACSQDAPALLGVSLDDQSLL